MKKVIAGLCAIIGISLFTISCSKNDNSIPPSTRNLQQEENNKQLVLKFYQNYLAIKMSLPLMMTLLQVTYNITPK